MPEFSSALPDFVQDHLVIEQCYLGKDQRVNLPDFTPSRSSVNINRLDVETSLTLNQRSDSCSDVQIPLDLPVRPSAGFPLDLPIADPRPGGSRSCPPTAEVNETVNFLFTMTFLCLGWCVEESSRFFSRWRRTISIK